MKIVVIGGTILIGSRAVIILRQRGHEVIAESRRSGITAGLPEIIAADNVAAVTPKSPSQIRESRVSRSQARNEPFNETVARYLQVVGDRRQVVKEPDVIFRPTTSTKTRSCRWARRVSAASILKSG